MAEESCSRISGPGLRVAVVLVLLVSLQTARVSGAEDEPTLVDLVEHAAAHFDTISSDALGFSEALVRSIEDSAAILEYYVEFQRDEFLVFTDGGGGCSTTCEAFRDQLTEALDNLQETLSLTPAALGALAVIQGLEPLPEIPPADLSPVTGLLAGEPGAPGVPGFVLYPLYDALSLIRPLAPGILDPSCGDDSACLTLAQLNDMLERTQASLQDIIEAGEPLIQGPVSLNGAVNGQACQILVVDQETRQEMQVAAAILTTFAGVGGFIGDFMILKSWTVFQRARLGFSFVGELDRTIDLNFLKAMGAFLKVSSKILEGMGSGLFNSVTECRVRLNNQVVFCMLSTKNIHGNPTFNTLRTCLDDVAAGDTPFGF
jgi:hypothetical protein